MSASLHSWLVNLMLAGGTGLLAVSPAWGQAPATPAPVAAPAPTIASVPPEPACLPPASWARPDARGPQLETAPALLAEMAQRDFVLLGEQHDDMDHHRWQLHTLAALHAQRPHIVIGFEMFPRRVQPVLERWVAGELSEAELLAQSDWARVWSMPAELYLPLFHFARLHRIPMVALNVDAALTRQIGEKGWDGVPETAREGVGRAAAPSADYEAFLLEIHRQHGAREGLVARLTGRRERAFRNFVDSQLTWDRAMAEAMVAARARFKAPDGSEPLVVGVMGNGHVRYGHGVAHQLRDLGATRIGQLMPLAASTGCSLLRPGLADAVFAVPAAPVSAPPPPRLGITLEEVADGVRISEVVAASLAEQTGLQRGDVITEAGGSALKRSIHLINIVRQQPPGTWLPLRVKRGEASLEIVVRFPPAKARD